MDECVTCQIKPNIKLYTTHCPKCKVLEKKLKELNLEYEEITDEDIMIEKGFMSAPILEVNGKNYHFPQAIEWVNRIENGVK